MGIATSASLCLRNSNQAHRSARNGGYFSATCLGSSQLRLGRFLTRQIHTVSQTTTLSRASLNPKVLSSLVTGNQSALEQHRETIDTRSFTSSLITRNLSGTSRSRSQAAGVVVEEPSDHGESRSLPANGENKSNGGGNSPAQNQAIKNLSDLQIFNRLVTSRRLQCDTFVYTRDDKGRFTCTSQCYIPKHIKRIQGGGRAKHRTTAKKMAQLSMVASLKKAGVWQRLVPRAEQGSGEEKLKAEQESGEEKCKARLHINDELSFVISDAKEALESAHLEMAGGAPVKHRRTLRSKFHLPSKDDRHFAPLSYTLRRGFEERLRRSRRKARACEDPQFKSITEAREMLPMRSKSFAQPVVDLIENNTYSIVVAETGSGKSTQIPQLILDAAIDNSVGADCQVLCVQPRRIAAKSLAHRVAAERLEEVGESVGYILRDDSVRPIPGGNITFCTSGILLMMLRNGLSVLGKYSHIILDEVHVRDAPLDLLMMLIKIRIEQLQSIGLRVPKITIMSATVDVNLFSSYFSNKAPDGTIVPAPHITVPGRTFHVKRHYLEEVLEEITYNLTPGALSGLIQEPLTKRFLDVHFKAFGEPEEEDAMWEQILPPVSSLDGQTVPRGLISAAVLSVLSSTQTGSVLVFVPGMQDIFNVEKHITNFSSELGLNFDDDSQFRLVKLHAQLPQEQLELDREMPHGCRRVIIATDIAEASLTIPDVRYVIDSGRVNQASFEALTATESITPCWISQNAAFQRAGRAGRVQAGDYYFLGLRKRFDSLPTSRATEIRRKDLQPFCLQLKRSTPGIPGTISELLGRLVEPPERSEVDIAVAALKDLKALGEDEEVTDLGHILDDLNVHPTYAKLAVLGIIFQCLDPMVIFAALGSHMNIFVRPLNSDMAAKIKKSRMAFAPEAANIHYEYIQAFRAVREVEHKQGSLQAAQFARNRWINYGQFKIVLRETERIMERLSRIRIPAGMDPGTELNVQTASGRLGNASMNTNSDHLPLIKALVTHCLSHHLAVKFPGQASFKSKHTTIPVKLTKEEAKKTFSPRQILCIFNYLWSMANKPTVMKEAVNVRPLTAALFGNGLERTAEGELILNDWATLNPETEMNSDKTLEDVVQLHKIFNEALETVYTTMPLKRPLSDKSQGALSNLCNQLVQAMTAVIETDAPRPRHHAPAKWDDEGVFVDDLEDMDWEDSSVGPSIQSDMDGEDR